MSEPQKNQKKVDLGGRTGVIELPKIDLTQYIGRRTRIVSAEEFEGEFGYYVVVSAEPVDDINGKPLTPSILLGLQTDDNGNVGWGEETKMAKFLASKGVSHYNDLPGKEVVVQLAASKNGQFLTIV